MISVQGIDGRVFFSQSINEVESIRLDLRLFKGLQIIRMQHTDGKVEIFKVLILD